MNFSDDDYDKALKKLELWADKNTKVKRFYQKAKYGIFTKEEICLEANQVGSPLWKALN